MKRSQSCRIVSHADGSGFCSSRMPLVPSIDVQVGEIGAADQQLRLHLPVDVHRYPPGLGLGQDLRVLRLRALDLQHQLAVERDAVEAGRVLAVDQHQRLHHVAGELFVRVARQRLQLACRAPSPP